LLFCKCFQSPRDTINCCRSWSGYVNWFTRVVLGLISRSFLNPDLINVSCFWWNCFKQVGLQLI
jgi:hypothetical protein